MLESAGASRSRPKWSLAVVLGTAAILSATRPGVPEPGPWSLMIAGFALAGRALRRRVRVAT